LQDNVPQSGSQASSAIAAATATTEPTRPNTAVVAGSWLPDNTSSVPSSVTSAIRAQVNAVAGRVTSGRH
jgi:hypothetical protein